ncbi:MAG: serine/threonine-protein kinase [Nannocystaceae bacterium]|nr:serine/threonine-protein kinase [Nannocystaceae bacterium]
MPDSAPPPEHEPRRATRPEGLSPLQSTAAFENGATMRPGERDDTLRSGPEPAELAPGLLRGTPVGRFIVLDRVGVGGMGVVYAAYDPELDRKVALKLVLSADNDGSGSGQTRLLREAQSMAQLSHPNVAAIYDVGTLDDGVYLAMEFIEGQTLTQWLAERDRHWREVVDVFVAAGRGIQAAHAAGIIHRDLKPDNLMIGRDGRVRVLDFGLARAAGGPRTEDATLESDGAWSPANSLELQLTAPGLVMGTPMYMAPEQHMGRTVDARSDVYAFCVALWESVYHQRPFNGRSLAEIATNVIAGRLVEVSSVRVPGWLHAALRRGLARRPEDRFPDMGALLAELGRDRSRTRRGIALGAALVGTLGLGAVAARMLARDTTCDAGASMLAGAWDGDRRDAVERAFEAEHKAYTEASFDNVARTLDGYASAIVAMQREACEAARVHGTQSDELMGRRMACLERRVRRLGALTEALSQGGAETVQRSVEAAYGLPDLGPCADAERLMHGVAPPEDATTRATVEALRGELAEQESFARAGKLEGLPERIADLLARARATEYQPLIAEVLLFKGNYEGNVGEAPTAVASLADALELAERSGHDPVIAEASIVLMLNEGRRLNRFDVAETYARRAAAVLDRMGDDPRLRMLLFSDLGQVENVRGRTTEALAALGRSLELAHELGRDDDPALIGSLSAMASALLESNREQEADEMLDRALDIVEQQLGMAHPSAGVVLATRARLRNYQRRYEESVAMFRQARDIFVGALGETHTNVAAVTNGEGLTLVELGRDTEAVAAFERAIEISTRANGPNHLGVAASLFNLGGALTRLGRGKEAVAHLERALAIKSATLGPEHEEVGWTRDLLGDAWLAAGDPARAEESYRAAIAAFERLGGASDKRTAYGHRGLGRLARLRGDLEIARTELERALELQAPDASFEERGDLRFELAQALIDRDPARARGLAREAHALWRQAGGIRLARMPELETWLAAHG